MAMCIRVSTPLKNTSPPSFLPSPSSPHPPIPLNWQTVQAAAPLFSQSPPLFWFFVTLKSDFPANSQNIKVFHP